MRSESDVEGFLRSVKSFLKEEWIAPLSKEDRLNDVGGFQREVSAIVRPGTADEVKNIVALANGHRVSLHPVSRGHNWGYGSKLPVVNGAVIVDLSRMNRVLSIDTEFGLARIEPGVTQKQLAEALHESPYFLDVTGSGSETSVLGNALERGIAYLSLRVNQIVGLEVVTGNGTVLRTGYGRFSNPVLEGLYPWGMGPSLDGLFFQSNLGIVTSAFVQLVRRTETQSSLSLSVSSEDMPRLIDSLAKLRAENIIAGIPHVADRERLVSTTAPMIVRAGAASSVEEARRLVQEALRGEWTVTASLRCAKALLPAIKKVIKKELRPYGRILFQDEKPSAAMETLIRLLASKPEQAVWNATRDLRGLHYGRPTDDGVAFLKSQSADIDVGDEGFLLCTPLAPLRGRSAQELVDIAQAAARKHGVRIGMTLNLLSSSIVEAVISVRFKKSVTGERERAQACVAEMTELFDHKGYYSYRVNIDLIERYVDRTSGYGKALTDIRSALDPNGVISPGKFTPFVGS